MAASVLFRSITIIDPQSPNHLKQADVLTEGEILVSIDSPNSIKPSKKTTVVEGENRFLSPGWIDMETHLADPGYEWKENIENLSQAAVQGGFTGIVCYPNTLPVVDNSQIVRSLQHRTHSLPIEFYFTGAMTQHAEGKELAEVYDMHTAGAVAFTDGIHSMQGTSILRRSLQYLKSFGGLLIHHSDDHALSHGGQMNEGPQSVRLGMKGIPEEAESLAVLKELELLNYEPGKIHFQPATSPQALDHLARAKKKVEGITVGTPITYFVFNDESLETFDTNYKVMPPLRSADQVKKLRQALKKGVIDALTTGHRAQSVEEKKLQFALADPGMLSLQTFFPMVNEHLIKTSVIDWGKFIELVSIAPRRILGLPELTLEEGKAANFTLFDPTKKWELTASMLSSRSKNSPLIGKGLMGQVLGVYCRGKFHGLDL